MSETLLLSNFGAPFTNSSGHTHQAISSSAPTASLPKARVPVGAAFELLLPEVDDAGTQLLAMSSCPKIRKWSRPEVPIRRLFSRCNVRVLPQVAVAVKVGGRW